jgi:predicted nucleic-acid-binding Zn-ribbon protein
MRLIMKNIICPKCRAEIEIVRETNWDSLDTYSYPVCRKCGWTTKEVFYNPEQIATHINGIKD